VTASGVGKQLKLRLFLEGQEVPVIGAQVSAAIGGSASANIQILATDRAMELRPRTLVHLFFRDFEHEVGGFIESDFVNEDSRPHYRLLFHGEVLGFQFVQTPTSRAVVLQCMDTASHWSSTYQFMINVGSEGNDSHTDNALKFLGSEGYVFSNVGDESPAMTMRTIMQGGQPSTPALQGVTGLLAGIIRILESVGGVADQLVGMNDFETISELRLKNLFQIAAVQGDEAANELFSAGSFIGWITGRLAQQGGLISIRDVINLLNAYIYHEVVPNPVARYVLGDAMVAANAYSGTGPVEELPDGVGKPGETFSVSEEGRRALHGLEGGRAFVYDDATGQSVSSYEMEGFPTIGYGHLIKDEADKARFSIHLLNAPGGRAMTEEEMSALFEEDLESRQATVRGKIAGTPTTQEQFDALFSFYYNAGNHETFARTVRLHNERRYTSASRSIRAGVNTSKGEVMPGLTRRRAREADLYLSGTPVEARAKPKPPPRDQGEMTPADKRRGARVLTQVFRPDVWFVAPPRCNVFFPEMYTRLNFQRNYMREITRYQLRSHIEIIEDGSKGRELRDKYYYAPRTDEFKSILQAQGGGGELRQALLMQHERFTGIIPKLDRLASFHFWSNQDQDIARAGRGQGSEPDDFANATAGFNFFRERFASRTAELSGYFNPYPVPGFPAVVIRRPAPPLVGVSMDDYIAAAQKKEIPFKLGGKDVYMPSQLIGMVATLSHSLNQQGGTTSVGLSHVRVHMGADGTDDEYLRLSLESGRELSRFATVTTFDAREAVQDGDSAAIGWVRKCTPQPGDDGKVPAATRDAAGALRVEGDSGPKGGKITQIRTSGEFLQYERSTKSITGLVREGDAAKGHLLYTTVQIYEEEEYTPEERAALRSVRVDLPFESSIFPAWFSPSYYNDQIGADVYQPWFGTGAVVDEMNISKRIERGQNVRDSTLANATGSTVDPLAATGTSSTASAKRREQIAINKEISVAEAVDILAILYGTVKASSALDANRFVQNYIYRPIATLSEMLGSDDLEFEQGSGTITTGWEGFSSRAIANLDGLKGLLTNPDAPLPDVNGLHERLVDKTMDPRIERSLRVLLYLGDLTGYRGLLG